MKVPRISVALDAPALARGVGFFETVWVLDRRAVFLRRHFRRLACSCRDLGVPAPSLESVERAVAKAAKGAGAGELGMRWSYLALEKDLDDPRSWRFLPMLFSLPNEVLRKRRGVRAVTLPPELRRVTPRWKTIDYRMSVAGGRLAGRRHADEGIFLDSRGRVLEGTASNVYVLRGAKGSTAPPSAGILPGVVRSWVIENASRAGITLNKTPFAPPRMLQGAFVSSSLTGLAPIVALDGKRCETPGREFTSLRELYKDDTQAGRGDIEI